MRVLGDRILVALPPSDDVQEETTGYTYREQKTASGLIVAAPPDSYSVERATRGIVVQLGEKRGTVDLDDVRSEVHTYFLGHEGNMTSLVDVEDGANYFRDEVDRVLMAMRPAPFDVSVGDCVIFSPASGQQWTQGEIDYVLLREDEILGVLEKQEHAA